MKPTLLDIFPGDGAVAQLCRRHDWASTPLGPPAGWPESLRGMIGTLLGSRHPMLLFWGPDLLLFCNDASLPMLGEGDRVEAALGARARDYWAEVWDTLGPRVEQVLDGGEATCSEDPWLPAVGPGHRDGAFWTCGFSPLRDGEGRTRGVLAMILETTAQVRAETEQERVSRRLDSVLESITDAFLMVDREGRFTFLNSQAERMLERARGELLGRTIWDEFPVARDAPAYGAFRRALREHTTVHFQQWYEPLERWFSVKAYPSDEGLAVHFQDITGRKRVEAALRESDRRFRQLAESMPVLVWSADAAGRIDYQTQAVLELTGRSRKEVAGDRWVDLLHPDDREAATAAWNRSVETGTPYEVEFRIRRHDGAFRWYLTRAWPFRDQEGRVVRWFGSSTDIHDRLAAEERLEAVVRATTDAVWDWDLGTDTLWWSEGLKDGFGVDPGSLAPDSSSRTDRIHPADRERVQARHAAVLDGRAESWEEDYRFRRGDGSYAWVRDRGFVLRDAAGSPVRVVGGLSDETRHVEAHRRIQEQAALLDGAQDAILVRDLDHSIEYWNAGASRIYGWSREEALGRSVATLLYEDSAAFQAATATVLRTGEWTGELEHRRKDGKFITAEGRWSLVRGEDGSPRRILSINTDITERKRLQAQFLRAQRMESIGTLAGGIAHDLNNVLAPILLSVGVLSDEIEDEEMLETLSIVQASAERGAAMIKQVLAFARGIEGAQVTVDLVRILEDLGRMVRDAFPKNIRFRCELPADLRPLAGDPTQIHQALMNLLVNARDAMPAGGELVVRAENVEVDPQPAAMSGQPVPGPHVRVSVSDTGEGMPPEVREQIFDPFFTTKEVGKGTGLGLSTVAAIMEGHRGFVDVESAPGGGTRFHLYFPADTGDTQAQPPDAPSGLLRGKGELILVVDDEDSVREITRQSLEAFGYRVVTARDGAEGLEVYRRRGSEIALVLTDFTMPVMDGHQVIRELIRMNPEVRIIAASGLGEDGGQETAPEPGARHFLPKPFSTGVLLGTVQAALED